MLAFCENIFEVKYISEARKKAAEEEREKMNKDIYLAHPII